MGINPGTQDLQPEVIQYLELCFVTYLFRPLPGIIEWSPSLNRSLDNLLPSRLDAHQQIPDQNNVLLLAKELQLVPGLI